VYQVDYFSKKFQVITFDVRGFGRSSKPRGPYSIRMFAEDTAALLRQLKIIPVHVMGISMGGMIALELALGFPHLIKSLVLINTYPEMRLETWQERMMLWRRLLVLDLFGVRRMGMLLSKILFIKPEQEELRKTFIEHWAENDRRAYRESLKAIVNWDVESRLGEIRCPVLVVASEEDYLPLEEKRVYTTKFPSGKLVVIEDARHAVTAERPEELNRVVDEFLTQLNGSRA
jgi:pimeloyl-ACP methyl ester carboxylesterase